MQKYTYYSIYAKKQGLKLAVSQFFSYLCTKYYNLHITHGKETKAGFALRTGRI